MSWPQCIVEDWVEWVSKMWVGILGKWLATLSQSLSEFVLNECRIWIRWKNLLSFWTIVQSLLLQIWFRNFWYFFCKKTLFGCSIFSFKLFFFLSLLFFFSSSFSRLWIFWFLGISFFTLLLFLGFQPSFLILIIIPHIILFSNHVSIFLWVGISRLHSNYVRYVRLEMGHFWACDGLKSCWITIEFLFKFDTTSCL